MADLGNLTKKVAGKVGSAAVSTTKAVGGVAGAIAAGTYNTIKTGFMKATDIDRLKPKNIAADVLDSVGLGAIMPAFGRDPRKNDAVNAAQRVADQNKATAASFKPMESLLQKLIDVNQKILDGTNHLVDYAKKQNSILEKANELVEKQTLQSIENAREANKPKTNIPALAANDNKEDTKKPGGFLSNLFDGAKGLLGFLAPIGNFISGIGSVLMGLARFAVRFLGPVGILAGIFLALEREDWAKLFDNLAKVFGDLAEGKIGDAIVRMIGTIGDVLLKGIGRIGVMLLNFFGFKDTAKDLSEWLDNFNLADKLVEWFHAATDWLSDFGTHLKEFGEWAGKKLTKAWDYVTDLSAYLWQSIKDIGTAFVDFGKLVAKKASDSWNYVVDLAASLWQSIKDIGTTIVNFAKDVGKFFADGWSVIEDGFKLLWDGVKDIGKSISQKFTDMTKAFSDWWNDFHPIDSILNTFGTIKDSITNKFNDAVKSFSDWWDSFSIIDIVLSPFNLLKDKALSVFDNLKKEIDDILSFDLAGKISESVSSLINGVWNFFKSLPSKAVDLVSGFIPDSLKNAFKSIFGGGETTNTPAPVTRPQEERIPLTSRNMALAIQDNMVNAAPSGREQVFNQQSAKMAVEQAAPFAPVIINNTNNSGGGGGQAQTARVSGAVQTAPQSSHIDRALYGNYYGAGVP
jgi:hypothetical protein